MSYHSGGNQTDASSVYSSHSRTGNNNNNNSSSSNSNNNNSSSNNGGYISSSLYSAFGGIMRRLSSDPNGNFSNHRDDRENHLGHAATFPSSPTFNPNNNNNNHYNNGVDGVYTPPAMTRTASPLLLRPPPLEPLTLSGFAADTPASARLLTTTVAEEIRIMVPERLRIEEDWQLAYSLDQDGASLATLYEKAARYDEHRIGFVLVVKDQTDNGGIFGAYLTEYPRPSAHYFGTGECFLWRASVLAPNAHPASTAAESDLSTLSDLSADLLVPDDSTASYASSRPASSSTSTLASTAAPSLASASTQPPRSPRLAAPLPPPPPPPPSIRFSAFPYSGVNEYFIYCEAHSLSVGGGDGRYGLWLNDSLDKGISATCLTFGNQPLSDEGDKFGVLGVELWVIGSRR